MSPEGRFWSAYLQGWRIPASLITLWWYMVTEPWLPHDPGAHHHGPHSQLAIPEPLAAEAEPALFA